MACCVANISVADNDMVHGVNFTYSVVAYSASIVHFIHSSESDSTSLGTSLDLGAEVSVAPA